MNFMGGKDPDSGLIKVIVLILIISIFFIFISWTMSTRVEARPLEADRKTTGEPQAKKYYKIEPTALASAVSEKSVIGQNVSLVKR